jgi:hypothetical protein
VRLRITPDGPGHARLTLWLVAPGQPDTLWMEERVPLDADDPWSHAVAGHLAAASGDHPSAAHVLGAIRSAKQAEFASRWIRQPR